jgi:hypothetical protein
MQKQRHGCLTAWLVLVIIANALVALLYVAGGGVVAASLPSSRGWLVPVLAVLALANVAFAIALFLWKRWGFYGFVASSLVGLVVNIAAGINPAQAVFGLVGVAILYGVLQIGNAGNKGWPQLE